MPSKIYLWDPLVRICHWLVAVLFFANMFWLEDGDEPHHWVGYGVLALVALRLAWGFFGTAKARFRDFYPTPSAIKHHWQMLRQRQADPSEGHNPLGGVMIFVLWFLLVLSGVSGYLQTTDQFWGEDWVELLHFYSVWATFAAVVVHVVAIIVLQQWLKLSLIKPMITGFRRLKD